MSGAHTPGPWRVDLDDSGGSVLRPDGGMVADVMLVQSMQWAEVRANARLIAAAPDLAAFAEMVATWPSDLPGSLRDEARAAIAKATGSQS